MRQVAGFNLYRGVPDRKAVAKAVPQLAQKGFIECRIQRPRCYARTISPERMCAARATSISAA
jgi:hypothetical protein